MEVDFEQAKQRFFYACLAIAGGLAVAGTFEQTLGGVIVLIGWLTGIASLHRLGRSGTG